MTGSPILQEGENMRQCFGRTARLTRCQRLVAGRFCGDHRYQPYAWAVWVITFVGSVASIWGLARPSPTIENLKELKVQTEEAQRHTAKVDKKADAAMQQREFQPLSPMLERSLRTRLQDFKTRHTKSEVRSFVDVESGSFTRERLAAELGQILGALQLGAYRRGTYIGVLPDYPATLVHGKGGESIAGEFREVIAVCLSGRLGLKENPSWPAGTLRLYLYAEPLFESNGAARFE